MRILAINGSPRKNGNTATLLSKALEGANSQGTETELIHLYELNYKGCISCFSCKLKNGKSYGKCALKDGLTPVLEKVENVDALILGSPIYFGNVTGAMRSFIERMAFPYIIYDENYSSLFKKKIPLGFIYTMNLDENTMKEWGYVPVLKATETQLGRIFGTSEALYVTDTYQFNDYSKYIVTAFDEAHKAKRRKEEFPKDCEKAFEMGIKFATNGAIDSKRNP
ncbi:MULTISPECIES: flavodoxin family protein [Sporomusa]|uniref:flavodoxin family protein n=1 Tax=Sporomusa TaxID=2375 RepID=UPI00202EAC47|nr:flavodoxin family protein [Sporomusa sphaeroides]MCM0758425.1 flavodoxin family protein [Sporomusa sphaeroides DSM 2875]HML34945.1 flavodoxin family protein [Sporomusa sphaeroides]